MCLEDQNETELVTPVQENEEVKEKSEKQPKEEAKVDLPVQPIEDIDTLPGNEKLSAFQIAERKKRTVFVGNIPMDMVPKKLWNVFKN